MIPEALQSLRNRHRFEVNSSGDLIIYKWNGENFVKLYDLSELEGTQFLVEYEGYKEVEGLDDEIDLDSRYETPLVYYVRAKCFLEEGDYERHNFYMQQFTLALKKKNTTKRDVQVEASEDYSLL